MRVGIQEQIRKNNRASILLLILFPVLLVIVAACIAQSIELASLILIACAIWFVIAFGMHGKLIEFATGSRSLNRMENPRVYNLLENLCIAQGMKMPRLMIIDDDSLNAFASGLSSSSFTITLSRGIIDKLNDEELEGVIAHELSHIINRDVRLLIVSIIFVGIFSFISEMLLRGVRLTSRRNCKNGGPFVLVAVLVAVAAYFISILMRFAISRNREYMADANAAEMTKRPYALANALRKISEDPLIEAVESRDVAQLFMHNPKPASKGNFIASLFATHPPIDKRIELLDQYV